MKFPTSRLARTTAAITLTIGLAYATLAQTVGQPKNKQPASEPGLLESSPTHPSELRPSAEMGRKQRQYREQRFFPFTPLWHPAQDVGGMVSPPAHIKVPEGLERVDESDAYLPEFPRPSSSPPGLTWEM